MNFVIPLLTCTLLISSQLLASDHDKSLCGPDERVLSYNQKIGLLLKKPTQHAGCTATMIGKSCAVTAGHCKSYLKFIEFNVEALDSSLQPPNKDPKNIYTIDKRSIKYKRGSTDWAVFKVNRNSITNKFPGELYGHYKITTDDIGIGDIVSVTGYGKDSKRPERSFQQQYASSEISKLSEDRSRLWYSVDTMAGDSGASIILEHNQRIIGIHTNGGCSPRTGGSNYGTWIRHTVELKDAIEDCLKSEF